MFSKLSFNLFLIFLLIVTLNLSLVKDNHSLKTSNITPKKVFTKNINQIIINKNITIRNYFQFLDSIVIKYDSLTPYKLTEHLLVRNNPWIIDTLANTDYYRMIKRDSFVYNQKEMIVLKKGSKIRLPDSFEAKMIQNSFDKTLIDINIPEYKLRIYEDSHELYNFSVRVGRNEKKYLKMGDRITDLRTKTGKGKIIAHVKNPDYFNPANGLQYFLTSRDDKKVTKLPQIPFIETEINGLRYGQLIHPTTNPKTLGKAYSNGCIGTKEADAWIIYYYTPIGTKINIRYDLNVSNREGKMILLKDIYK